MTNKPGVGKTRHKWLLGDLDAQLVGAQTGITEIVREIRRIQEHGGRASLQDLAMLVAELAQLLARARSTVAEMQGLVDNAPDAAGDAAGAGDIQQLFDAVADLQRQVEELRRQRAESPAASPEEDRSAPR